MSVSIFEPRTMFEMVNNEYRARSFLRDRYFKNVKTFNTETVDIDIVGAGKRKVAPFVGRRIGGTLDLRDGYKTHSFKPAYIAPFRVCTAEDALKRLPGEQLYAGKDPNERAASIVAQDLNELDKEITRAEEVMCSQALTTGKIVVKGEGVDDVVDFWGDLSPSEKPTATVSTLWSATNADPLTDLRSLCRDVAQKSGLTPVEIIAGAGAADALINALKGDANAFNSRRIDLGQINPRELEDGVSYLGALRLPNLDVYTYDEFYYDEASGSELPMMLGPNITGGHSNNVVSETTSREVISWGALKLDVSPNKVFGSSSSTGATYGFNFKIDASRANGIYGNSQTVQPLSLIFNYIIKY